MPQCLKVSNAGEQFIAHHEGFRARPYKDVAGNLTVGYGHLVGNGEKFDKPLSPHEAFGILQQDVSRVAQPGLNLVTNASLTQNQIDALGSFVFNVGSGATGFAGSSVLTDVNTAKLEAVPGDLNKWVFAGGHKDDVLVQRRKDEGVLFSSP